ncbi:DUF3780 domain-containing protein [Coprothermobacter platensis]|uniref:DUF3780 domain-containing protein n=1 Tax=Coprothermobacter platensis TaxID=108819 RepID=UPI00037E71A6|nr:DUF3780 domain-containing protein [Coprothermobacter platensis]
MSSTRKQKRIQPTPMGPTYGFGFEPLETLHHFMVVIPKNKKDPVRVVERFDWKGEEDLAAENFRQTINNRHRVELRQSIFDKVKPFLTQDLNFRLHRDGYKTSKWQVGNNPIHWLLGKEITLLFWAIEDVEEPDDIRLLKAIINWRGLRPEERWFLYDLVNAASGGVHDRQGWRTGIKWGLLENPVNEEEIKQLELFEPPQDSYEL